MQDKWVPSCPPLPPEPHVSVWSMWLRILAHVYSVESLMASLFALVLALAHCSCCWQLWWWWFYLERGLGGWVRKTAVRKRCRAVRSQCCRLGFLTLGRQFPPARCCSMRNAETGECVNGSGTKQVGNVWSISAGAGDPDFNHLLTGKNLPPSYLGGVRLLPPVRGNW